MKIIPYNPGSESAKALAEALGIKRVRREGAPLKFSGHLINWGCSALERKITPSKGILNNPIAVRAASNKKNTFTTLRGDDLVKAYLPEFTDELNTARAWFLMGHTVVERHVLNGHSGEGIKIKDPNEGVNLEQAPLYTKYILKKEEYRIHVVRDKVVFIQRKARKLDVPDDKVNWKVRNLDGGFIYANEGVDVPANIKQVCVAAIKRLGLDFGAVDVVWNAKKDSYHILEVNTAPGLTGRTLEAYKEAFNGLQ